MTTTSTSTQIRYTRTQNSHTKAVLEPRPRKLRRRTPQVNQNCTSSTLAAKTRQLLHQHSNFLEQQASVSLTPFGNSFRRDLSRAMVQVNREMCLTDARFRDILCNVSCSTVVRSTQKRFRCTLLPPTSACVLSQSMHLFCGVSSMCDNCTLSPISLAGFFIVVDVTPKVQN